MSCFEQHRSSRRQILRLAALCGLLSTVGCTLQPLYAARSRSVTGVPEGRVEARTTQQELAAIRILPLQDRAGQRLHNDLRNALNPLGQPATSRYDLSVAFTERREESSVRADRTATRGTLRLHASYELRRSADRRPLHSDSATAISSYNIVESGYAVYAAEQDALERGLLVLAEEIRRRLSAYFASADAALDTASP
jgi:hypothetical protein